MAAYGNPGPSSDSMMYEDSEPQSESKSEVESDKEDAGEATTTIPKSLLAGKDFKPGEEIMFQIVSMHDDTVVVKYASEKKHESSNPEEGESDMPAPADNTMASNSMYE